MSERRDAGEDVKAAFARWKGMLGDVQRNLEGSVLHHLSLADPEGESVHCRLAVDYVREQLTALRAITAQMGQSATEPYYPLVRLLGIEDDDVFVPVMYWAEFLRGPDGACAFCSGDDWDDPTTPIGRYLAANRSWANTCPVCQGRPT